MGASVEIIGFEKADAMLGRLDIAMRGPAVMDAVRASLKPVVRRAKQLCPKGGPRIGTKAGKKHLKDTITSAVRDYGEVKVGVAGPAAPAGAHGHNVEHGHNIVRGGKIVGRAAPHPFMRPAAEQTKPEQQSAFETTITKHVAAATGAG